MVLLVRQHFQWWQWWSDNNAITNGYLCLNYINSIQNDSYDLAQIKSRMIWLVAMKPNALISLGGLDTLIWIYWCVEVSNWIHSGKKGKKKSKFPCLILFNAFFCHNCKDYISIGGCMCHSFALFILAENGRIVFFLSAIVIVIKVWFCAFLLMLGVCLFMLTRVLL